MKVIKYIFALVFIMVALYACSKDDEANVVASTPPRDREEQQVVENDLIKRYLETHFYTLVDNDANPNYQIPVFDTIAGANSGQTSMWDSGLVEERFVERQGVMYEFYTLKLNTVESDKRRPTFADSTLVTYRGELFYDNQDDDGDGIPNEADVDADGDGVDDVIDDVTRLDSDNDGIADDSDVDNASGDDDDGDGIINDKDTVDNNDINRRLFDNAVTPQWLDQTSIVIGLREALSTIRGASGSMQNPDGTVSYNMDYGHLIVFMPSGLAYYNFPPTSEIPVYSPLIFNVQLYVVEEADHDRDGIPSHIEHTSLDGTKDIYFDIDTDGDGFPDYVDFDDDGDRTLTRNEVIVDDANEDGFLDIEINPTVSGEIRYFDDDGDGIYNHLDNTDTEVKN